MSKSTRTSRRAFLGRSLGACASAVLADRLIAAEVSPPAMDKSKELDFPLVDLHVHLDNSTIDQVLPLSKKLGVKFGIVEHAGTKENKYPTVLSNDEELKAYVKMLAGKDVYKGVQAEWSDWMKGFSREALALLDYTLTDTMTFPGKDGSRVKLWEKGVEDRVDMADKQAFMDRYVDWHVEIISKQPIDILANTSWLPEPLAKDYDTYWTDKRMAKVFDAAVKYRVALEISSGFSLPTLRFLKAAKAAGIKFTFGSNGRYPKMGLIDFSVDLARKLGLKATDMFTPAAAGQKAVERRTW
jgi:histidinol phosphatase-like PHP family hydrolase